MPVSLTRVELDHLLTVLRDARQDASYYGNREQYYRRADRIWNKLADEYKTVTGEESYPLRPRAITAYDSARRKALA